MSAEGLLRQLQAQITDKPNLPNQRHPLTLSVDLRNSGYKLAPIDVNLFPGGWHNLCSDADELAISALRAWLPHNYPNANRIGLFCDWATRNPAYIENVHKLSTVIEGAGFSCIIIGSNAEAESQTEFLGIDHNIQVANIEARPEVVQEVDLIVSNSDFGLGIPAQLKQVGIPIEPPPALGWHQRKKMHFYDAYHDLVTDLAQTLGLDPWTLCPLAVSVDDVDFWNQVGTDRVADAVDKILDETADAYRERGIDDRPFAVVKDEAGTFGMGVLVVDNSDMVRQPNRKVRQKMQRGKGGRPIESVLVQEGVYTRDVLGNCVAEPVVMTCGGSMIGGFFRYHCSRGETENLNTKGMVFAKLQSQPEQDCCPECVHDPLRTQVYGWLAEVVSSAAATEIVMAGEDA